MTPLADQIKPPTSARRPPVDAHAAWAADAGVYFTAAPAAKLVNAAVGLFEGHRVADKRLGVTLLGDSVGRSFRKGVELGFDMGPGAETRDHVQAEGPRFRVLVGPGVVEVRRQNPVRHAKSEQRRTAARIAAEMVNQHERRRHTQTRGAVAAWSSKSRSNMTRVAHSLDWAAWDALPGRPGLVTLTAPDRWLEVFPTAASANAAIRALCERFYRDFGYRMAGLWKREFQDRRANCLKCRRRRVNRESTRGHVDQDGNAADHPDSGRAPHWHILMRVPEMYSEGAACDIVTRKLISGRRLEDFDKWLAREWVDVVTAKADLTDEEVANMRKVHSHPDVVKRPRGKWTVAGIVSYFTKHGSFTAKSYQNVPPAEWVDAGSVGRYWGRWKLDRKVAGVEVPPEQYDVIRRTMRRWSRANSSMVTVKRSRRRHRLAVNSDGEVDSFLVDDGERRTKVRQYQLKGPAGFLVLRDGPAFASALARAADRATRGDAVLCGPPAGALARC